jgi:putative nucleotidyltransferase with HDIG domain
MPSAAASHRARLSDVIRRRARVTPLTAAILSLAFALVVTPVVLAETWFVAPRITPGQPANVTVRVPAFDGWDDQQVAGRGGSVIIARGEIADRRQAAVVNAMLREQPSASARFAAYAAVLFLLAVGVTHQMRRSNRGRLLRVQLVILGTVALGAIVTKGLLLAYPVSVLAVPVALGAMVPTLVFDRTAGLAAGVLSAVTMALLVPFDVGIATVLVVQAVAAAIVLPDRARPRWATAMVAGAVAMLGAALTYLGFFYLSDGVVPVHELAEPARSAWLAAGFGGAIAGVLALPLLPLFERACGEITHARLVAMEDLSHPLLKQISDKSPGTWQHSLAMANLAEVAAQGIGANGRLVRVGAYFHDLGKSLQPSYFIENLRAGEPSPHDQLAPEVSCDAIFAHVTEGIALARRSGVPERIIDFMHMHHGDGVLEYFWAKCQEQGNPRRLTIEDFRYPGVPPQSRETAILAICDAVEAASRTLKRPDERAIESLVQRIVYGKLHLGQLDESGLSMADLRRMSDSLREAIRAAHHDRIEYPWQREAAASATVATVAARAATATQRLMHEPRLDSLDAPRPMQWEHRARAATHSEPAVAATEPMPSPMPIAATSPLPAAPVAPPIDATVPLRPSALAAAEREAIATAPTAPPIAPVDLAGAPTLPPIAADPPAPVAPAPAPVAPAPAPVAPAPPTSPAAVIAAAVPPTMTGSPPPPPPAPPIAAAAPAEVVVEPAIPLDAPPLPLAAPPPSGVIELPAKGTWAATLSSRLDAMLEQEEEAFAHAPTHRTQPPPPPRGTTAPPPAPAPAAPPPAPLATEVTHEVAPEDVEATIDLTPSPRSEHSGLFKGPPPATRPVRTIPAVADPDSERNGDDGPTVVRPRPAGGMLPPRSRTRSD